VSWAEAKPFKDLTEVPTDPVTFWSGILVYSVAGKLLKKTLQKSDVFLSFYAKNMYLLGFQETDKDSFLFKRIS
jgi:hypothetical protein